VKIGRAGEASVVVIDASVAVEFLVQLRHTAHADLLFGELGRQNQRCSSGHPICSFPNRRPPCGKLVRLRAITTAAAATAVDRLGRLPVATTGTAALLADAWRCATT